MHFIVIKISQALKKLIMKKKLSQVFEVAHYDFEIKNEKFKMADSKWLPFMTEFDALHSNGTKMNLMGFSRSFITISRSKMKNSEWRIQYGCHF